METKRSALNQGEVPIDERVTPVMGIRISQVEALKKVRTDKNKIGGAGTYSIINKKTGPDDFVEPISQRRKATASDAKKTIQPAASLPDTLPPQEYTSPFEDVFADLKSLRGDRIVFMQRFREHREDKITGQAFLRDLLSKFNNMKLTVNDPDIPSADRNGWRLAEGCKHRLDEPSPRVTMVKQGRKIESEIFYIFQGLK